MLWFSTRNRASSLPGTVVICQVWRQFQPVSCTPCPRPERPGFTRHVFKWAVKRRLQMSSFWSRNRRFYQLAIQNGANYIPIRTIRSNQIKTISTNWLVKNDQDISRDGVAAINESPIFPNFLTYMAEKLAITGHHPRLASAIAWAMNKFINRLNLVWRHQSYRGKKILNFSSQKILIKVKTTNQKRTIKQIS